MVIGSERQPPSLRKRDESGRCAAAVGHLSGGNKFRDDLTGVGHEHALARADLPHVFTQTVLQVSQPYGLHSINVASCSYIVKRSAWPDAIEPLRFVARGARRRRS